VVFWLEFWITNHPFYYWGLETVIQLLKSDFSAYFVACKLLPIYGCCQLTRLLHLNWPFSSCGEFLFCIPFQLTMTPARQFLTKTVIGKIFHENLNFGAQIYQHSSPTINLMPTIDNRLLPDRKGENRSRQLTERSEWQPGSDKENDNFHKSFKSSSRTK
jgi:hypothetical protein